jgi:hypothetical protein
LYHGYGGVNDHSPARRSFFAELGGGHEADFVGFVVTEDGGVIADAEAAGEFLAGSGAEFAAAFEVEAFEVDIRMFVDEAFAKSRVRFGPKRKSGARRMKGSAAAAGTDLWSIRDLRAGIG